MYSCDIQINQTLNTDLENLIFLLAPHRMKQEGIEVFLRTMLVFTAKSVFFGIGLAFFFTWSSLAKTLSEAMQHSIGLAIESGVLFLAGSWVTIGTAAWLVVDQLSRVFRRLDPACRPCRTRRPTPNAAQRSIPRRRTGFRRPPRLG